MTDIELALATPKPEPWAFVPYMSEEKGSLNCLQKGLIDLNGPVFSGV